MAQEENEEDFPGRLLHQAALWSNAELLEDLLHGEMIEFLNAKDSHGRTALHAAATNENETCTRILLQAGADPNIACGLKEQYKTALHIAAENGQLDIARLLLEYEADLLAKDSSGLTAMDLAEKAEQPHVMELLKEAANNMELKCPWCKKCFTCIDSFTGHQKIHNNETIINFHYLCSFCSYSSNVACHLKTHLMRHYGVKPYKCEICGFSSVEKAKLKRHLHCHYKV